MDADVDVVVALSSDGGMWLVLTMEGAEQFAHGHHDAPETLAAVERHYLPGRIVRWVPTGDGGFRAAIVTVTPGP